MRKLTTSARYVLYALIYINWNEPRNIGISTVIVTLE